ncbi:hypothetical protein DFH08DRAFT_1080366, partial [Mycena albidolilacea]
MIRCATWWSLGGMWQWTSARSLVFTFRLRTSRALFATGSRHCGSPASILFLKVVTHPHASSPIKPTTRHCALRVFRSGNHELAISVPLSGCSIERSAPARMWILELGGDLLQINSTTSHID